MTVLGEYIVGSIIKVDELVNTLRVALNARATKLLMPIISAADMRTVPLELMGSFQIIFYQSAENRYLRH